MKNICMSVLVAAIFLTGCTQVVSPHGQGQGEAIFIGWIGPLSTDSAIIGEENLRGVEIAVENINARGGVNGKRVELVVADDQFDAAQTISVYKKMTQVNQVEYVLTATYGGYLALAPQAQQDGIILLESLDTSEEFAHLGENAFAVGIYDESIGYSIAEHLHDIGAKRVGVLVNMTDPFVVLVKDAMASRYSGEIQIEEYVTEDKDFRTRLQKMRDVDALVVIGWEETGRIVKQARELGMNHQIVGIDTFASEDFRSNTGGQYENLAFTFWKGSEKNSLYTGMLDTYQGTHEQQPENVLFVGTGHDAAWSLLHAMEGCEELTCVQQGLKETNNLFGATGLITMDEDHITRSIQEDMYTYQGDEIVPLN